MSGVLYVVSKEYRGGPELFEWTYTKETAKRFRGGDNNALPYYRSIIAKGADGVPERGYRRTPSEAVQAYVDGCNYEAQRCRDRESALKVHITMARALDVSP